MLFSEIKLDKSIQKALLDLEFKTLTPIQEQAIPFLLENNTDLIALAQTGTGKTAAFSLPVLNKTNISRQQPQTLILCPTRELCLQISKDISSFAKHKKNIKITPVYGGANISTQIKSIKSGAQIIVGTPGRIIDLIKRKVLKLKEIEHVVLDEADEMLNMGFKEDLDTILSETPSDKQTMLFSATMPKEVMRISKNYMSNANTIEITQRNVGAKDIEHFYYLVNAKDKYQALRRICDINPNLYGIVFCRTRRSCSEIAEKLIRDGYNADALHGELSQSQRDHVMKKFRNNNLQILVATDVAARGIDVNNLSHVINYDLPDDIEVYVHRSGRTGRAGNKGISIIIAHNRDGRKIDQIKKMIKKDIFLQKIPTGNEICQIQLMNLIDKVVSTKINEDIKKYLPSIENKFSDLDKKEVIELFVSTEFNRFLTFYKKAPDLNTSAKKLTKNTKQKKEARKVGHAESGYTRFFINIGKNSGLQTHNLIGLINEFTKNNNIPIGKIDIMKKFSFFEIPEKHEGLILKNLNDKKWKGNKISVEKSRKPESEKSPVDSLTKKRKFKKKSDSKKTIAKGLSFKQKFNSRKKRR